MSKHEIIELFCSKGWNLRERQMTPEELKVLTYALEVDTSAGLVKCDSCNKDYTNSKEKGGIVVLDTEVGGMAVCPKCAPRFPENKIKYKCPPDLSFADWVRNVLREKHRDEGLTTIIIESFKGNLDEDKS